MPKRDGVFQRKDAPGWYASYTDSSGKRRKKRVEAHTRTQALEALSLLKARAQRETLLGVKEIPETATKALFDRYERHQAKHVTAQTCARIKTILKGLLPLLPSSLKQIDRKAVAAVVDARMHMAAATVQKELTILKHAFRLAVEWELMASNPAQGVKLPKVKENRTRYLSPPELKIALTAAPEWLRPIIALAAFTGMRRGELLNLKWADIDGNRAYLHDTKNGELGVVTLNKLALTVLASVPRKHPHVFHGVDPYRLSMRTIRLFKSVGIDDASFHTLRHTTASLMVMGGVDLYTAGQVLRHKTPRMTSRYAHLSPGHMAKATGTLDVAFEGVLVRDSHETNEVPKPSEHRLSLPN